MEIKGCPICWGMKYICVDIDRYTLEPILESCMGCDGTGYLVYVDKEAKMKDRPRYFLSDENIDQEGEAFDYIRELHDYLWRFVRVAIPGASGSLSDFVDNAIGKLEGKWGFM